MSGQKLMRGIASRLDVPFTPMLYHDEIGL